MKYSVINMLTGRMGEPSRQTQKLQAWYITSGFSVAVQLDQPSDDAKDYALVWLPKKMTVRLLDSIEQRIYCEDEGRHSNTYASPGLEKGSSAIRLKIENAVQLEQLETALFEGL